ncbi:MAG: hypothetical protein RIS79_2423, partial [Verrucomicrobiota bacterium]
PPEEKAGGLEFTAQDRFVSLKRNRSGQGVALIDAATEAARKDIMILIEGETK